MRRCHSIICCTGLQGVASPSQRRYVGYIERALFGPTAGPFPPPARRTLLTVVVLSSLPTRRGAGGGPARLAVVVESLGTVQYDQAKRHGAAPLPDRSAADPTSGVMAPHCRVSRPSIVLKRSTIETEAKQGYARL
jgi:hypothetical protein